MADWHKGVGKNDFWCISKIKRLLFSVNLYYNLFKEGNKTSQVAKSEGVSSHKFSVKTTGAYTHGYVLCQS